MALLEDHGGWAGVLATLTAGRDLSAAVAREALGAILSGNSTDAQISGFIVALRQKGETVEEMAGLVGAMRDAATPLDVPEEAIDIVGVGGAPARRAHALNVSTMASFVASGAGATVCKHGNRRASSTSGSFDLLDEIGVDIDVDSDTLARIVRSVGVGFAFARTYHPAMRHVAGVRAELGIPTVFNVLGPLSNPGRVKRQVIGVSDPQIARSMAEVLAMTGSVHTMIVHGHGGLDELTTTGRSQVTELRDGAITQWDLDATQLGLAKASPDDLVGGDATRNAAILAEVLDGRGGPYRDIVVLNAAAGLVVAGVCPEMATGVEAASAAIDSGRAAQRLEALVNACRLG